jgi:hypothetical protein
VSRVFYILGFILLQDLGCQLVIQNISDPELILNLSDEFALSYTTYKGTIALVIYGVYDDLINVPLATIMLGY